MIKSVVKAFRALELLDGAGKRGLGLGEVAQQMGLKAPSAHNLLATLVELGFAAQDADTRNYSLGERAGRLGRQRHTVGLLAGAARPVLDDLGRRLGETVLLALYRARRRHTLLTVESEQALRVVAPSIVDDSFHSTATGRMMLALLPVAERQALMGEIGPPDVEWPEAQRPGALELRLKEIRSAGAVILHRRAAHTIAIAVPLLIPGSSAVAALGCYYPSARSQEGREETVLLALRDAAEAIALRFEAASPPPTPHQGQRRGRTGLVREH